jgi:molybdopterin-containing oxidoreductase family iron-sulfur binding subunit
MKILGFTSGTAMLSSCGVDKANEKIIPYVISQNEDVYPGNPRWVKTTCSECPALCGMQVRVNEKVYQGMRGIYPTKLEGLAGHPVNEGALCMRGQSGLFRLYHPDRIRRPLIRDEGDNLRVITWAEALNTIRDALKKQENQGKSNIYFSSKTSGSLSALIDQFCRDFNVERDPEFEIFNHANLKEANRIVFGRPEIPRFRIEKSDFMLTVGADLFETFITPVFYASGYSKAIKNSQFYWYHAEPHVSMTGVQANHRLTLSPESEVVLLSFLLQEIVENNLQRKDIGVDLLRSIPRYSLQGTARQTGIALQDLQQLVQKLFEARNPLIISGGVSTAHPRGLEVSVLTALLQWVLGMTDELLDFAQAEHDDNVGTLRNAGQLVRRLEEGDVGVIFLSKVNPVGQLPENFNFDRAMTRAGLTVGMADCMNETIKNCQLILPLSHSLESWGDAVPNKGIHTLFQPAIERQHDSRSEGEILLSLMNEDQAEPDFREFMTGYLNDQIGMEATRQLLEKGFFEQQLNSVTVSLNRRQLLTFVESATFRGFETENTLMFAPSVRSFDGRSRDLPLLQELPDPVSTITYGEWMSVSPDSAHLLGLRDGDEVEVNADGFSRTIAVKIQKLLRSQVFVIQRDQVVFPATSIDGRSGELSWYLKNVTIRKTGQTMALPVLSGSMHEEERGLLPHEQEEGHEVEHHEWYPEHDHENYRWGMAIDLESCIGCNACAAACYVENNIPLVGREEHLRGREMSWIRLQPYYQDKGNMEYVPMLCQHCDNAPCEPVCPVYAAYHNEEGLNVQVYNRCVGTRYCANNCPYKVRRFNWFDFRLPEPLDKMYNPALSVRDRGIMEKCTFCIQRIRQAKDSAKDQDRLVRDGEVIPACAQTCPTEAITFGNLKDENSKVYQLSQSDRAYRALEEIGTKPAISYLRKKEDHHEA